ncbi:MAG: hypothetical protein Q9227_005404 [Pyrenula ochraceoflavens]
MTFSTAPIIDSESISDRTPLADFTVLAAIPIPQNTVLNGSLRLAHMCEVDLCARVFQAETVGGMAIALRENECAQIKHTRRIKSRNATHFEVVFPEATPISMISPDNGGKCRNFPSNWQNPNPIFRADLTSVTSLRSFFTSMFNEDIERGKTNTVSNVFEQRLNENFKRTFLNTLIGSYQEAVLLRDRSIQDPFPNTLDAMMVSLVAFLRDWQTEVGVRDGTDSPANIGTYLDSLIRIHVGWMWLLFPLMLEVSAMVLLLATIVSTKRRHMPIWKTSTIAALVHGVDVAHIPELVNTEKISSMDELLGSEQFQLRDTGKGYRLVRCFVNSGCVTEATEN